MLRITAIYGNSHGSHFDTRYYLGQHAERARELLRPHGLKALRLTTGVSALDGTAPPFWAVSEMLFESRAAFDSAMNVCGSALMQDAANYTDVAPVLQISALADPTSGQSPTSGEI
jgi:uncharacterized protein (TIGR02118 family)